MNDLKVFLFLLLVAVVFVLILVFVNSLFGQPEYLDTIPQR